MHKYFTALAAEIRARRRATRPWRAAPDVWLPEERRAILEAHDKL